MFFPVPPGVSCGGTQKKLPSTKCRDNKPMRLMEISNFISLGIRGANIKPAELLRMVFLGIDYEKRKL